MFYWCFTYGKIQTFNSSAHTIRMTEDQEVSYSKFDALSMDADSETAAAFYTGLTRKQVIEMSYDD